MGKRVMAMALMFLCMLVMMWSGNVCKVFAADIPSGKDMFSGDVQVLKQEGNRYVMQVTVENKGEDFAGTVQAIFSAGYDNCAYETDIVLPAQGKKQFTVTVPERAADTVYGICQLNFLDEKGNVLQSISLKNIFNDMRSGISVGILSDRYSDLTFMDAGGEPFYVRGMNYPINLVELDHDNLAGYLDGLYFLIIDHFNTSTLSAESVQAVQDWVRGGGWLIIGTGQYVEQTLSGFEQDFLDVEVQGISEPGEENIATVNANKYGYYYSFADDDIDLSQMTIAELGYNRMYAYGGVSESVEYPAVICPVEDGAISLLYFSLSDGELQKMSSYRVQNIYQEVMYQSDSYQNIRGSSELEYVGQRVLAFIDGCNSDVDFSWLKVLIVVYVILVGPILYLILRKCKRSEWYWVGAPGLGILFIAGVFVFGRGLSVKDTKVYSVTVQQTDSNQADTYMLAYHSGVKPWKVRLQDSYEVAGPGFQGYSYYGSGSSTINDYHYIVGNDDGGLSVGLKPRENFENGFLYAGKRAESVGSFIGTELKGLGVGSAEGTIMNGTGRDLEYMAVWSNTYLMVFSDVKAEEVLDLEQAVRDNRCVYQGAVPYYDNLMYDLVGIYGTQKSYSQEDMAALLIALGVAEEQNPQPGTVTVVGVVEDYDKAVADKCSETAYGCFYSYVKVGVTGDLGQAGEGGEQYAAD